MQVPPIESPRLVLRPYCEGDFDAFAALNGNAELRRRIGGPLTPSDAAERFQSFISGDLACCEAWAITMRDTGAYTGHCWLAARHGTSEREMGLLITPDLWRQGYGTEVAVALLDYALAGKRYARVVATVDEDHTASIRVLERAGMRRECKQRDERGVYLVYSKMSPDTPPDPADCR